MKDAVDVATSAIEEVRWERRNKDWHVRLLTDGTVLANHNEDGRVVDLGHQEAKSLGGLLDIMPAVA